MSERAQGNAPEDFFKFLRIDTVITDILPNNRGCLAITNERRFVADPTKFVFDLKARIAVEAHDTCPTVARLVAVNSRNTTYGASIIRSFVTARLRYEPVFMISLVGRESVPSNSSLSADTKENTLLDSLGFFFGLLTRPDPSAGDHRLAFPNSIVFHLQILLSNLSVLLLPVSASSAHREGTLLVVQKKRRVVNNK
jgi:hypothetical protein